MFLDTKNLDPILSKLDDSQIEELVLTIRLFVVGLSQTLSAGCVENRQKLYR